MSHLATGAWVVFRVQLVPATPGVFPPGTPPDRLPANPFFEITERSIPINCDAAFDFEPRGGEMIVASYVLLVKIGPAPLTKDGLIFFHNIREKLVPVIAFNAAAIQAAIEAELKSLPSPSPPGAPPGLDTGKLAESIEIRPDEDGLGAAIGSPLDYARFLEFGTEDMVERPFLFCALEGRKQRLRNDVQQRLRKTFGIRAGTFLPTDRLGNPKRTGNPMVDAISFWANYSDQEGFRGFSIDPGPTVPDKTLAERFDESVREARESFDEFMNDPSNFPADPPNVPPTPPFGPGRVPLPIRLPKRLR